MSDQNALYRRISRRETRSPRSTLAIVVAIILIALFAWAGTEIILRLVSQPPLLVSMPALATWIVHLSSSYPFALIILIGIVIAVVGLILMVVSITAGRLARHQVTSERSAVIVDNEVIASALARHAAFAGNVDPDNVRVSVSHRTAVVRLTPASGIPVSKSEVEDAVAKQLDSYNLTPTVRSKVIIDHSGRIGS